MSDEMPKIYYKAVRKFKDFSRRFNFDKGDYIFAVREEIQKYGRCLEEIGESKPKLRRDSVTGLAPKILTIENSRIVKVEELASDFNTMVRKEEEATPARIPRNKR